MATDDVKAELDQAVKRVLDSNARKKLVVAGPGAGKTTLFRKLLEGTQGEPKQRLVLTFIGALKEDLERNLGDLSSVFTLHGYCQYLLRRDVVLRGGLTKDFRCYPGLASLIKIDWQWLKKTLAPTFVSLMRDTTCSTEESEFYTERADYYDGVDFDDSVHRVLMRIQKHPECVPEYSLVLIDEFQDFNKMEASIIDLLAVRSPILIAGDDDQALYSQLRDASWDHIRAHYTGGQYEIFELPFCMRCTEVIVGAVNDIVKKATQDRKLDGRISKPFRYYEPFKGPDSVKYPHIEVVETTVQRSNANYFGRYIEECIRTIPESEKAAAAEKNEPVALIIGSNPYRRQIEEHLSEVGLLEPKKKIGLSEREEALRILSQNAGSNLGWRIILACGDQAIARDIVVRAAEANTALSELISQTQRESVLAEAQTWATDNPPDADDGIPDAVASVAVTSYEGSKGRSAQYVFLAGVHSGEIPGNANDIKDIEICRFLVGLTRTKKRCSIFVTSNAMGKYKRRSEFIGWMSRARLKTTKINAAYWTQKKAQ